MKTTAHSIINFAYFTANFTKDFIAQCWKDEPYLVDHLTAKFLSFSNEQNCFDCGSFIRFFFELDRDNQLKLANWINNNYKGIF